MSHYLHLFFGVLMLWLNETPCLAVRCYKCQSNSRWPAQACKTVNCPGPCEVKEQTFYYWSGRRTEFGTKQYKVSSITYSVGCYGSLGKCGHGTNCVIPGRECCYTYSKCFYDLCNRWPGYRNVVFSTERATTAREVFPLTTTRPNKNDNSHRKKDPRQDRVHPMVIILPPVLFSMAVTLIVVCYCNSKYYFVNMGGVWVRHRLPQRQRQARRSLPLRILCCFRFRSVTFSPRREQPNSEPSRGRCERRDSITDVISTDTELAARRQRPHTSDVARNPSVDSISHDVGSPSTGPPTYGSATQNDEPPSYGSATQNDEPPSYGSATQNVDPTSYGSASQNDESPSCGSASQNVELPFYGSTSQNVEPPSYESASQNVEPPSYGNTSQNVEPSSYENASQNVQPSSYGSTSQNTEPPSYGNATEDVEPPESPFYESVTQNDGPSSFETHL